MANQRDYYKILEISPKADPAIIKAAYYTQLKTLKKHPDLGGSHEEATLLNEAYEVLGDPIKRKEYDEKFFKGVHLDHPGPAPSPFRPTKEHRKAARAPFQQTFRLKISPESNWTEAQFRDISLLGACLRSLKPFNTSQTLELDISQEFKVRALATVRWVRKLPQRFGPPLYEGGVEFQTIDTNTFRGFLKKAGLEKLV